MMHPISPRVPAVVASGCLAVLSALWAPRLASAAPGATAPAGERNLVANGSFEEVEGTAPSGWAAAGDSSVTQELTTDAGQVGKLAAKLRCTAFAQRSPSSHAMLAQVGKVALTQGKTYRFSCWLRGEDMAARHVRVAISDTSVWANCGLESGFVVGRQWKQHVVYFTARRTVDTTSRLQFWFGETGTLWVDDVRIVPAEAMELTWTSRVEPGSSRNLLPNGSFECGRDGWTSLGRRAGWGNLSGLHGTVQEGEAAHGRSCLRIDLAAGRRPVTYFDYFEPVAMEQKAPLAASLGWARVRKGAKYTLSAWMRADRDGVPGALLIRQCDPGGWAADQPKKVALSRKWQRFELTATASRGWLFVAAGPDLTEAGAPAEATAWVDAVQLEQAEAAGDFVPRQSLEIGVETARFGNVFAAGEPVTLLVGGANAAPQAATVELAATAADFFGATRPAGRLKLDIPAGGAARADWVLNLKAPGWYAVDLSWEQAGVRQTRRIRLAIIPPYEPADSPFGINHAPPTAELCRLLRQAGVVWARDWSLKWQHVEPAPGRFDPAPADTQIGRVLAAGMRQVCLLPPFPSANWASSAPPTLDTKGYPGIRLAMAYAPKDPKLLEQFIERCVRHYKGRVNVWDFLNEPIYTDYSLPGPNKGAPGAAYTVADYVRLLKGAYAAMKRADPNCRVLGGIGSGPQHLTSEFIAAGGLDCCDILNLHIYPDKAPPEGFWRPMQSLLAAMRRAGRTLPIWITEYSYYAADEPPWEPFIPLSGDWAAVRLLESERQCADYSVRFAAVMLACGVEKVFYHSGASGEANRDSLECCLVGYAGQPRKVLAAQAAMTGFLGPAPRFAARIDPPASAAAQAADGLWALAFDSAGRGLVIAWADVELAGESWTLAIPAGAEAFDIVGRKLPAAPVGSGLALSSSPIYITHPKLPAGELARSCRFIRP